MIKRQIVERILVSIVGMTLLGIGIGIIVNSKFGSDSLTLFIEALQSKFGLTVGTFNMLVGVFMLIVAFICDKKKIGFATVFYVVTCKFVIDTTISVVPIATNIFMKTFYILFAILLCAISTSLSISARLGLAYYDAFIFSVSEKFKINSVVFRYAIEAILLTISILWHTYPNIGTLICFALFGPSINYVLKIFKKPLRQHWNMPYDD